MANSVKINGVLVSVHGIGILIRGRSGSGKSLAALNLMRAGHRLVSDDLVEVVAGPNGKPIGRSVEQDARIEVRGLGIYRAASLFRGGTLPSATIDFVVELDSYDPSRDAGRTGPMRGTAKVLNSDLLSVRVPVPVGTDPALLIEMLARLYKESGTVEP